MEGRIGCNGSQGGVRKKLESKLVNQHPSSRGDSLFLGLSLESHEIGHSYPIVLAERKLTSYVYAVGKQPASNL
ncbi:hypothetical protein TIFTF001_034054 [Ficus carica]|uniref:Uncharacterized protein n=1 Tax=Ficus carica TaxID=3494 RepID=A0AA88DZ57_FICCA|nr:hypothetical protein TIFTF001_034054 [Ficus carica]